MQRKRLDVLVVDDDVTTRDLLARAIADLGHTCRTANDGAHALATLAERAADVVVSDWEMPGMNGADLCSRLRTDVDRPYTYFILLTGYTDREHLISGMEAGADDFQRKPVDLDELEARLVSAARVVALHRCLEKKTEELQRDSRRFYVLSRTDVLTGIGNRAALEDELAGLKERALRYGYRYSIAIADVDHFKEYNDALGHLAGDAALRTVAQAIRSQIRTSDGIFRYGGEEFVIVLPEQTVAEATAAMERVRREIVRIGLPAPHGVLSASFGVAELDDGDTTESWLARADSALYVAKAGGRNRVAQSGTVALARRSTVRHTA